MWRDTGVLDLSACGNIKPLISIFHQTILMNLIIPKVALFFGSSSTIFGSKIGLVQIKFALFGLLAGTSSKKL